MSYIRPLENQGCLYIYPEEGGIRFSSFLEHNDEVIKDEMLDILLARMGKKEIKDRIKHGNYLLKALDEENLIDYYTNKSFCKGEKKWS